MRSILRLPLITALVAGLAGVALAQPGPMPPEEAPPPEDEVPPVDDAEYPPDPGAPPAQPMPPQPQPPPGYLQPAPMPPPPPPPVPSNIDPGVYRDANIGRSWLSPTAMTPPKGTWSFQDYELLFVGGSYAFTDQFQVSANTMIPIVEDQPLIILASAKLLVARTGKLRLALHGTFNHFGENSDGDGDVNFYTGTVGGVATLCLDADCDSLATGYVGAGFGSESDGSVVPIFFAGSLLKKLGRRVKLAVEIDSAYIAGEIDEMSNGFLGWYGVRFTSKNIGVDVGFVRPFGPDVEWEDFPMGFPVVSLAYRDGL